MKNKFKLDVGNGKKVETKLRELSVDSLSFFPENPRISSLLMNYMGKLNNASIHKLMWEKQSEATRELYHAIKKAGNVNEPLLVYKNSTIEGNTRLCVLRELYKDTRDKKWKKVNCRVVGEKLSEKQISYLLCHIHIASKKKDWEPFEQACYFNKMAKGEDKSINFIKEITGFGAQVIRDYITTYREMQERKASSEEFSMVYETIKQKEVKEEISKGTDMVGIVRSKFAQGKISKAEDVRKLRKILRSDEAKKQFLFGSADIEKALKITYYHHPEENDQFLKDISDFIHSIKIIPINKLQEIKKDKKKISIINELYEQVNKLYRHISK